MEQTRSVHAATARFRTDPGIGVIVLFSMLLYQLAPIVGLILGFELAYTSTFACDNMATQTYGSYGASGQPALSPYGRLQPAQQSLRQSSTKNSNSRQYSKSGKKAANRPQELEEIVIAYAERLVLSTYESLIVFDY